MHIGVGLHARRAYAYWALHAQVLRVGPRRTGPVRAGLLRAGPRRAGPVCAGLQCGQHTHSVRNQSVCEVTRGQPVCVRQDARACPDRAPCAGKGRACCAHVPCVLA